MKHALTVILVSALALSGCAKKAEKFTLKDGTPAFALAKDLAAIVPALGPDKSTVLVETKSFVVTAAEVIQAARDNLGTRSDQLKTVDAGQMKKIIDKAATSLAERKLLLAAAAAAKTVVPAEELDKALQSEYAQAGGEQAFLEALKQAERLDRPREEERRGNAPHQQVPRRHRRETGARSARRSCARPSTRKRPATRPPRCATSSS